MKPLALLGLLRWPLAFALLLVALGAAAVLFAQDRHGAAMQAHRRAATADAHAVRALARARAEEGAVHEAIARYEALAAAGLAGTERRLAWVEALDAARVRHGVAHIAYEIQPQRRLAEDGEPQSVEWMESRMRLSMTLRHGEVLLRVLDELQRIPSAIVQPRRCRIARGAATSGALAAECELHWLTLRAEAAP